MNVRLKGNALLMITAVIWGTSFVAQKAGMDLLGPVAFNGIRTLVGAASLIPVIVVMNKNKEEPLDGWHVYRMSGEALHRFASADY